MAALKATCDQLRAAARAAAASEAAARAEAAAARQEADGLRQDLAQAASNAILQEQFKEVLHPLSSCKCGKVTAVCDGALGERSRWAYQPTFSTCFCGHHGRFELSTETSRKFMLLCTLD